MSPTRKTTRIPNSAKTRGSGNHRSHQSARARPIRTNPACRLAASPFLFGSADSVDIGNNPLEFWTLDATSAPFAWNAVRLRAIPGLPEERPSIAQRTERTDPACRCRGRHEPDPGLERTQPMLPMGLGYVEGVTHDYRRHGTTTLFAALDTAIGKVITQCRQRREERAEDLRSAHHRGQLRHKHPRVKRWFAARPQFQVHFTPTYALWLNQVEIWFNRITQQAIRRGTFRSVKELVEKIDQCVQSSNTHAQPFVWTATADSIFAKVERLCDKRNTKHASPATALSVLASAYCRWKC